jgi:hypothetical protein
MVNIRNERSLLLFAVSVQKPSLSSGRFADIVGGSINKSVAER